MARGQHRALSGSGGGKSTDGLDGGKNEGGADGGKKGNGTQWWCPKCGDPCTHVDTFVCEYDKMVHNIKYMGSEYQAKGGGGGAKVGRRGNKEGAKRE